MHVLFGIEHVTRCAALCKTATHSVKRATRTRVCHPTDGHVISVSPPKQTSTASSLSHPHSTSYHHTSSSIASRQRGHFIHLLDLPSVVDHCSPRSYDLPLHSIPLFPGGVNRVNNSISITAEGPTSAVMSPQASPQSLSPTLLLPEDDIPAAGPGPATAASRSARSASRASRSSRSRSPSQHSDAGTFASASEGVYDDDDEDCESPRTPKADIRRETEAVAHAGERVAAGRTGPVRGRVSIARTEYASPTTTAPSWSSIEELGTARPVGICRLFTSARAEASHGRHRNPHRSHVTPRD